MKTFFNKNNRSVTYEFPLTGAPIGEGNGNAGFGEPTLKLSVSHYKFAKALIANVSYVEKDKGDGYAIEKWQSDWPLIRIASKAVARYSEKALKEFAAATVEDLQSGRVYHSTVTALLERVVPEEAAA